MIWLFLSAAVLVLVGLLAACWWGSNIVFHPPKMLPHTIWPDLYKLTYDPVEFPTADGLLLKGWLIPASTPTDRTILLCHGWGDNKGDLLQHTHALAKKFNLFFFDVRHHGESQGALSSIGYLESRDAEAAMRFLKEARPAWTSRLGIFGLSMGAAMAIWTAARHTEVKAGVYEAPFSSFNGVIDQFSKNNFNLPYFPFTWLTLLIIRLRLGGDPEPYSPIHHVSKLAPRPSFFIAGSEDRLMPPAAVRQVFEAAAEPKELWVIPGARHGKYEEAAGAEYPRRLAAFFDTHL